MKHYPWSRGDILAAEALNEVVDVAFSYTDEQINAHYPSGGATVYVGETAPASPKLGSLWWKPSTNTQYIWDGASWMQTFAPPGGLAPLVSPAFTGNPTAPTPAPGDNDTSIATTAFVAASVGVASDSNPLPEGIATPGTSAQYARTDHVHPIVATGNRNAIVNGQFDVWQRGVSFAAVATGTWLADHWRIIWDGSGFVAAVSQYTATDTLVVDSGFRYQMQYSCSNAGSGGTFRFIEQRIERVNTLSGTIVTVSFIASSSPGFTVGVSMVQFFGTGGSPSATVTLPTQNVSVTGTSTKFTLQFTIPSIAGKVYGSNNDDFLGLRFNLPLGTVGSLWLTGVQVERGPVATLFEFPANEMTLISCQRFYQVGAFSFYAYAGAGSITLGYTLPLTVQMRGALTVTYSPTTTTNVASGSVAAATASSVLVSCISNAAGGVSFAGTFTVTSEI